MKTETHNSCCGLRIVSGFWYKSDEAEVEFAKISKEGGPVNKNSVFATYTPGLLLATLDQGQMSSWASVFRDNGWTQILEFVNPAHPPYKTVFLWTKITEASLEKEKFLIEKGLDKKEKNRVKLDKGANDNI